MAGPDPDEAERKIKIKTRNQEARSTAQYLRLKLRKCVTAIADMGRTRGIV